METALITGAGSFIGYEMVRRLTSLNVQTSVIVRSTSDTSRLEKLDNPPQIFVTDGNIENLETILIEASPEIVFHFAGVYSREEKSSDVVELIQSNIQFATHLLQAICQKNNNQTSLNKVKGLVNTGSYFQYYNNTGAVLNLYAATKNAFEQIAAYYSERYDFPITTMVLFDIFGERDWRNKLFPTIRSAQISGVTLDLPKNDLLLNFLHVDNAVDCFLASAKKLIKNPEELSLKNFAVRETQDVKISDIIKVFEKIGQQPIKTNWGKWPAPTREIEIPWRGPTLLGWQPKISLEDGIRKLIESKIDEN